MNLNTPRYIWSDAWLLTSIYGASTGGGEPTLSRIIGVGDFLNHAIFTLSELNGGLNRLKRGGLIEIEYLRYPLTEAGRKITEEAGKRAGVRKHMENIRNRLHANPWAPNLDPNAVDDLTEPTIHVSDSDFRKAFDEYHMGLKRKVNANKKNRPRK